MSSTPSDSTSRSGPASVYVEVMKAENGTRFLKVTETSMGKDANETRSIFFLFGESCEEFKREIVQKSTPADGNSFAHEDQHNPPDQDEGKE